MSIIPFSSHSEHWQNSDKCLWHAALKLEFRERLGRTVLALNRHEGPLRVQRPFYPDADGCCHCYLLHPPGGVVGGDQLSIDAVAREKTNVLITTPGAGKFYNSPDAQGVLNNTIYVSNAANMEWLPQETIFYNGANATLNTIFKLDTGARLCAWDITCLGRPAANESFDDGRIAQRFEIWRGMKPVLLERFAFSGSWNGLNANWGWRDNTVNGVFVATDVSDNVAKTVLERGLTRTRSFSVTKIKDTLIARYLGDSSEQAKSLFIEVWHAVRRERDNRAPTHPRIWNT